MSIYEFYEYLSIFMILWFMILWFVILWFMILWFYDLWFYEYHLIIHFFNIYIFSGFMSIEYVLWVFMSFMSIYEYETFFQVLWVLKEISPKLSYCFLLTVDQNK